MSCSEEVGKKRSPIRYDYFSLNSTPGPNKTYNSAEWLGFYKVSDSNTLAHLLRGYIEIKGDCEVPVEQVGLAWDAVCFMFLILQKRLFSGHYFFHMIDEAKAMAILASRGAELIEELSQKQIQEQQETERRILEKIKYKMDRIKASQKRIHGSGHKEPSSHQRAIRSGDYYMFDDMDDEELDLIMEKTSEDTSPDEDLDKDQTISRNKKGFGVGVRTGTSMIWQPLPFSSVSQPAIR
ncbi:hypothetical protein M8J77_013581 [Diaphorina citri]|nr:hypothetical protein M8J77_013581 [Diaphorina citri]